jgi:predicted acyltransferase
MEPDFKPSSGKSADRLLSIDALRGFDMFWIIGGDALLPALAIWAGWPYKKQIAEQLEHVPWEGFHFYDLIFPLFLFLVGAVLPFSLGRLQARGATAGELYWRVIRRATLLFVLGLIYNDFLRLDFDNLRLVGVLQRIALCYLFAALIMLNTGIRGQALITAIILLGYWALLAFVPAPGFHAGDYSSQGNLSGYVDRVILHDKLGSKLVKEYYGDGDNEGLLSTIPAVATTLLGVLAGHWLRSRYASGWKFLGLLLAGAAFLAVGLVWGQVFPIIKNIWTSSYVMVAAGWSLLLLALFYLIIDVFKLRAWAFFFIVIGANAITIYVVAHKKLINFEELSGFFLNGLARFTGSFQPILLLIGALALAWLFLLFLYRHRIFLRV